MELGKRTTWLWKRTNQTGLAAVIDVHQIRVEVQMRISAHLNGSVSRDQGPRARRKAHPGKQAERSDRDLGEGFRSEPFGANDYFLDFSVGRLLPMGREWYHVPSVIWLNGLNRGFAVYAKAASCELRVLMLVLSG
jgi:hypothetical protein